jgi:hypothetical protein
MERLFDELKAPALRVVGTAEPARGRVRASPLLWLALIAAIVASGSGELPARRIDSAPRAAAGRGRAGLVSVSAAGSAFGLWAA